MSGWSKPQGVSVLLSVPPLMWWCFCVSGRFCSSHPPRKSDMISVLSLAVLCRATASLMGCLWAPNTHTHTCTVCTVHQQYCPDPSNVVWLLVRICVWNKTWLFYDFLLCKHVSTQLRYSWQHYCTFTYLHIHTHTHSLSTHIHSFIH